MVFSASRFSLLPLAGSRFNSFLLKHHMSRSRSLSSRRARVPDLATDLSLMLEQLAQSSRPEQRIIEQRPLLGGIEGGEALILGVNPPT